MIDAGITVKTNDVVYRATICRHGKTDAIDFYNQSFEEIGRQLDVLTTVYNHHILKIEKIQQLTEE